MSEIDVAAIDRTKPAAPIRLKVSADARVDSFYYGVGEGSRKARSNHNVRC